MFLPSMVKTKERAHAIQCMNNCKQMALGYLMYANDYGDILLWPNASETQPGWINSTDFVSEDAIRTSATFPYLASTKVFHCPADKRQLRVKGTNYTPNRSYSLNIAIGKSPLYGPNVPPYKFMLKMGDMTRPRPSAIYLLLDEHELSINDSHFVPFRNLKSYDPTWLDAPGVRHGGAAGFAFADGHSEIHTWVDSAIPPFSGVTITQVHGVYRAGPKDHAWITNHIGALQ